MSYGQQQPNAYYPPQPGFQAPPAGYYPPPQQGAPYYPPQQQPHYVTAQPPQATTVVVHEKKKDDDCWKNCCLCTLCMALCCWCCSDWVFENGAPRKKGSNVGGASTGKSFFATTVCGVWNFKPWPASVYGLVQNYVCVRVRNALLCVHGLLRDAVVIFMGSVSVRVRSFECGVVEGSVICTNHYCSCFWKCISSFYMPVYAGLRSDEVQWGLWSQRSSCWVFPLCSSGWRVPSSRS